MTVNVFVWKATKEQLELVNRITKVIQDAAPQEIKFNIQDVSSFTPEAGNIDPTITFGKMAQTQIPHGVDLSWKLPDLKQLEPTEANKQTRVQVATQLKEIASILAKELKTEELTTHVEIQNTSIGVGLGEIQLTQDEIDSLLKIKQLLNGGTVVLQKGDIRIEVPDGNKTI